MAASQAWNGDQPGRDFMANRATHVGRPTGWRELAEALLH